MHFKLANNRCAHNKQEEKQEERGTRKILHEMKKVIHLIKKRLYEHS